MVAKRQRRRTASRGGKTTSFPRRARRAHYLIITLLTALASLALLVAGYLGFSTPGAPPTPANATPLGIHAVGLPGIARADGESGSQSPTSSSTVARSASGLYGLVI